MIATLLAVLVVLVAFPISWFVTYRLGRLSDERREVRSLRERAIVGLALSIVVSVFAATFVNNEMPHPFLDGEATRLITRSAVLGLIVPKLYWLFLYR